MATKKLTKKEQALLELKEKAGDLSNEALERTKPLNEEEEDNLCLMVQGFYRDRHDNQQNRITKLSRIRNTYYRRQLAKHPEYNSLDEKEKKKLDKELQKERDDLIKRQIDRCKLIRDEVENKSEKYRAGLVGKLAGDIFEYYQDYVHIELYLRDFENEKRVEQTMAYLVMYHPMWSGYFEQIKGVGPVSAAVLLGTFKIGKKPDGTFIAPYVSCFWKYSGLDVVVDPVTGIGARRSKKAEHLIDREYVDKNGEIKTKKSITYKDDLKSFLLGVLAGSLMVHNPHYKSIYDDYRHRIETDPGKQEWTKAHVHNDALGRMMKIFIKDFWIRWRQMRGYEVIPDWYESKFGHYHKGLESYDPFYKLLPVPDSISIPDDLMGKYSQYDQGILTKDKLGDIEVE